MNNFRLRLQAPIACAFRSQNGNPTPPSSIVCSKIILALALGVAAAISPEYDAWRAKHGIDYDSAEEHEYRFGAFVCVM